ncbi:MAG: hypothetical protein IPI19_00615 [Ignavibacteriales bacterium]|jgi:hypothetical protein|nr:hypothetical protein [Ignavibacteriales bacterium]MBP9121160.1 hypothetical protein [Ignavibacterium sp.]
MKKIFFLTIILLPLSACDLFTTRNAENPDQTRSNFQPPVEPAIVIENLKSSLSDKNVQNYIACFVDTIFADQTYNFSASSEAISLYQIFVQGWGLNEERRYFSSVTNRVPVDFPISLSLSNENYSSLSGDSLVYSATYSLNLPVSSSDPVPQNYAGNLQFNMLRDSRSEWVIYYWKDTKSESLPSWSELKGSFY